MNPYRHLIHRFAPLLLAATMASCVSPPRTPRPVHPTVPPETTVKVRPTLTTVSAASGVSVPRLEVLADELEFDLAEWEVSLKRGILPESIPEVITRESAHEFARKVLKHITREEALAIVKAVSGLDTTDLHAWALEHAPRIERTPDGSVTREALEEAFDALVEFGINPNAALARHPYYQKSKTHRSAGLQGEVVLYDATKGTRPGQQGWWDLVEGERGVVTGMREGVFSVDSMSDMSARAGFFTKDPFELSPHPHMPVLDRASGFVLQFHARLRNEKHLRRERAGFSVSVVTKDLKGIELAFWEKQVWAQSDRGKEIFERSHAEGHITSMTSPARYSLSIQGDTYALAGDGTVLLTGSLRDYSRHRALAYRTPSFLFLGDNTTSAGALFDFSFVSLTDLQTFQAQQAAVAQAFHGAGGGVSAPGGDIPGGTGIRVPSGGPGGGGQVIRAPRETTPNWTTTRQATPGKKGKRP